MSDRTLDADSGDPPSEERRLVVCRECGQPFPAKVRPDGTLVLIGVKGCSNCDDARFRVLSTDSRHPGK